MRQSQRKRSRFLIFFVLLIVGLSAAFLNAQDSTQNSLPDAPLPTDVPIETTSTADVPPPEQSTGLPTPTEPTLDAPVVTITETPLPTLVDSTPDAPTAPPPLPTESPLHLLVRDLLDSGDLSHWQLGEGWSLVPMPEGTGYALQTVSANPARLTKGAFFNASARLRFALSGGSISLSLRVSESSRYTTILDSSGLLRLLRGDALLASVALPPVTGWHTLQLSVINDILRVTVDEIEWIALQDSAPLPPGNIEIVASGDAPLLADDFFLFVPEVDYSLYPTPTDIPQPTPVENTPDAPTATEVLPTPTESVSTPTGFAPTPTLSATVTPAATAIPSDRMVAEAEDNHLSRYGQWQFTTAPNASGGQVLSSSGTTGDALEVFFGGTDITLTYLNGLTNAAFTLVLDGNPRQTLVTTQQTSANREEIRLSDLSASPHHLRIEAINGMVFLDTLILETFVSPLTVQSDMSGVSNDVIAAFQQQDTVQVIVVLNTPQAAVSGAAAMSMSLPRQQAAVIADLPTNQIESAAPFQIVPAIAAEVTENGLVALQENPLVASVQLDVPVYASLAESRALMHVPAVEGGYGLTGRGVTIAVLDTGIGTHPDLNDSILAQQCFVTRGCPSSTRSTSSNARDGHGHGTHVSGIITSNNDTYRGIASNAGIVAVKVLDDMGSGYFSDVVRGLEWVYLNRTLYNIRLVNLSLGGGGYTGNCDATYPALTDIVNRLYSAGVVVFAASGNNSTPNQISMPACVSNIVSVGSIIDSGASINRVSAFSNASTALDLLAPGESITSTIPGGGFISWRGTSMASPSAVGVAALLLEAYPNLTSDALIQRLKTTGVRITDTRNGLSYPRVDALAAMGNLSVPPVTILSTTGLDTVHPIVHWQIDNRSIAYQFEIAVRLPNAVLFRRWYTRATVCGSDTGTTCELTLPTTLSSGRTYSASVRQQTSAGISAESYSSFTVAIPVPTSVTMGITTATDTLRPIVNWMLQGNALYASNFQITVSRGSTVIASRWYTRAAVCGSESGTVCAHSVPATLTNNREYTVSITPRSAGGSGSAVTNTFTVFIPNPGSVTISVGSVSTSTQTQSISRPTVQWTLQGNALYTSQFQIAIIYRRGTVLKRWYTRATVCGSDTGTNCVLILPNTLAKGTIYTISITPRGIGGTGTLSSITYTPS